jgi:alcohol dehydrogenase (cytochrome c)
MDLNPIVAGESSLLSSKVGMTMRPRDNSDGRYGRLEAIDLATRKSVWVSRRRAFSTTGVLSTDGGLVFAGYLDRNFVAFDSSNGKELWTVRLNDVPNANPISYSVNGRQYIAITVGNGGPIPGLFAGLVPEIKNPTNRTAALWVFSIDGK